MDQEPLTDINAFRPFLLPFFRFSPRPPSLLNSLFLFLLPPLSVASCPSLPYLRSPLLPRTRPKPPPYIN